VEISTSITGGIQMTRAVCCVVTVTAIYTLPQVGDQEKLQVTSG